MQLWPALTAGDLNLFGSRRKREKGRSVRPVGRALAELRELVDLKRLHLVTNLFEIGCIGG